MNAPDRHLQLADFANRGDDAFDAVGGLLESGAAVQAGAQRLQLGPRRGQVRLGRAGGQAHGEFVDDAAVDDAVRGRELEAGQPGHVGAAKDPQVGAGWLMRAAQSGSAQSAFKDSAFSPAPRKTRCTRCRKLSGKARIAEGMKSTPLRQDNLPEKISTHASSAMPAC